MHVVPSRWDEPFSLSLLEGMAMGLAVVASATGGIPEVLGRAGILTPRDDPETLAMVLAELLDDADMCRQRGQDARRRAETLPWSAVWDRIVALAASPE